MNVFPKLRFMRGRGFDHDICNGESGELVANVLTWGEVASDAGTQIARLFAAAPDLYEACQAAEFCLSLIAEESDMTAEGNVLRLARKAIAKATLGV